MSQQSVWVLTAAHSAPQLAGKVGLKVFGSEKSADIGAVEVVRDFVADLGFTDVVTADNWRKVLAKINAELDEREEDDCVCEIEKFAVL